MHKCNINGQINIDINGAYSGVLTHNRLIGNSPPTISGDDIKTYYNVVDYNTNPNIFDTTNNVVLNST